MPKQKNFKKEIKETSRYKRIVANLKSEETVPTLAFVSFIAQEFEKILIPFQTSEPLIHILYESMCTLLFNLLSKFIKKKYLFQGHDGDFSRKPMSDILSIDVGNPQNIKPIHLVDIETKARSVFSNNKMVFGTDVLNFSLLLLSI